MKSAPRLSCMAVALIAAALIGGCGSAQSRKARYIEHGQQYLAAGNYDKARVELRNALQIDPRDGTVRLLLGQVAERTGDVREALGQYQAAIAANSQLAEARAALGRLFLLGGLPDKAMEPRRMRSVFTVFVLGCIVWGVVSLLIAAVREHSE